MENAPLIPTPEAPKVETKDSDSEKSKDKKKRRGIFEVVRHEEERERPRDDDKEKNKKERHLFSVDESKEKEPKAEGSPDKKPELKLAEAEPVSAAEAPDEELGAEEVRTINQVTAEALNRHKEVDAEANPEEAAAELASQRFLEEVAEHGDPDMAVAKTAQEVGATPDEIDEIIAETELPDDAEAPVEAAEIDETEASEALTVESEDGPTEFAEDEEELVLNHYETEELPDENEDDTTAAATGTAAAGTTGTAGAGTTVGSGTGSAGGGHGAPAPPYGGGPGGPSGPFGPGGPGGPGGTFGGPGGPGGPFGGGFNTVPRPAAANQARDPNLIALEDQANPATMALFGAIIGYLYGRRRGRIKAEKKFKPVKRKFEKQVESLQFDLNEKDKKIRKLAAEKARQQGPALVEVLTTKTVASRMSEKSAEHTVQTEIIDKNERVKAPEARQLHGKQAPEMHIGHVLMGVAEAPAMLRSERPRPAESPRQAAEKTAEAPVRQVTERRVETMSRSELMSLSEKIMIEESSLRQIYETKLIGEKGLRRIVAEYLRGGDVKKVLRQEIIEREIDFERDPILRDMAPTSIGGGGAGGGRAVLEQMLAKAKVPGTDAAEEAAYFKARAQFESEQRQHQQKQRHLIDTAMVSTILILVALVTYLILMRG